MLSYPSFSSESLNSLLSIGEVQINTTVSDKQLLFLHYMKIKPVPKHTHTIKTHPGWLLQHIIAFVTYTKCIHKTKMQSTFTVKHTVTMILRSIRVWKKFRASHVMPLGWHLCAFISFWQESVWLLFSNESTLSNFSARPFIFLDLLILPGQSIRITLISRHLYKCN